MKNVMNFRISPGSVRKVYEEFVYPKGWPHVVVMRGSRMHSKSSLLDEFSAALQFPDYFGHNWDAFEECFEERLEDEIPKVIVFIEAEQILSEASDKDFEIFFSFLLALQSTKEAIFQFEAQSPRLSIVLNRFSI